MEDTSKQKKYSRRNFLEKGATGVAGVALGLGMANVLLPEEPRETVKMLTADGKLVEVEKRHLPQTCGNPVAVSNMELQEWMKDGKQ